MQEFGGNSDRETARYQYFSSPFVARFVRLHPVEWHKQIAMRAGLIGCPRYGNVSHTYRYTDTGRYRYLNTGVRG